MLTEIAADWKDNIENLAILLLWVKNVAIIRNHIETKLRNVRCYLMLSVFWHPDWNNKFALFYILVMIIAKLT